MLAELTPQQLVEWRAAIEILGLDDSWQQAGTVASEIRNASAAAAGVKLKPDQMAQASDYIPLIQLGEQKPIASGSGIEDFERAATSRYS